ncbi:hypothetical protein MPTK2_2g20470 [Marchantia polymorpha subsp. ruderalis]
MPDLSASDSSAGKDSGASATSAKLNPPTTAAPPPAFKPSRATDNDTYFDRYFKPLPGDIVLCEKLEFEKKDKTVKKVKKVKKNEKTEKEPPVLAKRAVSLYYEGFDKSQFHPGDYILRIGMFELSRAADTQEQTDEWCWKDLKLATLHVYWPNYHSRGDWFLVAKFVLQKGIRGIIDPDAYRLPRDFKEDPKFKESHGDIILRRIKIADPTRPWGWAFKPFQLQEYWIDSDLQPADIVVHVRGHFFPEFRGRPEERDSPYTLQQSLFRLEADCCWCDPVSQKWLYGGQAAHNFKVKATQNWITQERFHAVPKPGDILITQGENLLKPITDTNHEGSYVQIYNERRFFYPGNPPLATVNVRGPGNMAVRFGHFDEHWVWEEHAALQLFHYHENHGAWYTLGPVVLPHLWTNRPDYKFEQRPLALNSVAADLIPRDGDLVIRKPLAPPPKLPSPLESKPDLRTHSYFETKDDELSPSPDPFWKRVMKVVPFSAEHIRRYPLVPGDCILRAGLETAGPLSRAKYNATAELYMLSLDHWDRKVWVFRGRDKTFFGGPAPEPYVEDYDRAMKIPHHEPVKRDLRQPVGSVPRLPTSASRRVAGKSRDSRFILLERARSDAATVKVSPSAFKDMLKQTLMGDPPGQASGKSGPVKVTPATFKKMLMGGPSGSDSPDRAGAVNISPLEFSRRLKAMADASRVPAPVVDAVEVPTSDYRKLFNEYKSEGLSTSSPAKSPAEGVNVSPLEFSRRLKAMADASRVPAPVVDAVEVPTSDYRKLFNEYKSEGLSTSSPAKSPAEGVNVSPEEFRKMLHEVLAASARRSSQRKPIKEPLEVSLEEAQPMFHDRVQRGYAKARARVKKPQPVEISMEELSQRIKQVVRGRPSGSAPRALKHWPLGPLPPGPLFRPEDDLDDPSSARDDIAPIPPAEFRQMLHGMIRKGDDASAPSKLANISAEELKRMLADVMNEATGGLSALPAKGADVKVNVSPAELKKMIERALIGDEPPVTGEIKVSPVQFKRMLKERLLDPSPEENQSKPGNPSDLVKVSPMEFRQMLFSTKGDPPSEGPATNLVKASPSEFRNLLINQMLKGI